MKWKSRIVSVNYPDSVVSFERQGGIIRLKDEGDHANEPPLFILILTFRLLDNIPPLPDS